MTTNQFSLFIGIDEAQLLWRRFAGTKGNGNFRTQLDLLVSNLGRHMCNPVPLNLKNQLYLLFITLIFAGTSYEKISDALAAAHHLQKHLCPTLLAFKQICDSCFCLSRENNFRMRKLSLLELSNIMAVFRDKLQMFDSLKDCISNTRYH